MKNPSTEPIAHVAASYTGGLFVAAHYEEDVFVFDFNNRKVRMHLETDLDFGGNRLAVMGGEQPKVIVGSGQGVGLSCYDVSAGGLKIWHRPELQTESITVCDVSKRIGVITSDGEGVIVGASTGQTYFSISNVDEMVFSVGQEKIIVERDGLLHLVNLPEMTEAGTFDLEGKAPSRILPVTTGLLVATFGDGIEEFAVESEVPTVSYHSWSGRPQWSISLDASQKVLALSRQNSTGNFLVLTWNSGQAAVVELITLSEAGEILSRSELPETTEYSFFGDGEHLVDSDGSVRNTTDLSVEWDYLESAPEFD